MSRWSPFVAVVFAAACSGGEPAGDPVRVTIPRGASVTAVADSLVAHQIIESPRWFRLYAKISRNERNLQAGVYDLIPGAPAGDLVRALVRGRTAQARLVLPEGLMLTEVAGMVENQLGIAAHEVLAADARRLVS